MTLEIDQEVQVCCPQCDSISTQSYNFVAGDFAECPQCNAPLSVDHVLIPPSSGARSPS